MLVLSRRVGEKIFFPEMSAYVTVLSVMGGCVRLGIEAPPEIQILRDELWNREFSARPVEAGAPSPTCD